MIPGSSADCPWGGLAPANLHFCERELCSWITEPANTWTNLGFVVVGVVLARLARRDGARAAGLLGPIAIATGLCSAALHATSSFAGQFLDQSAMFLESALFVALCVRRWLGWSARALAALYAAIVAASVGLLLAFESAGIGLFVAHVLAFLGIELRLFFRDRRRTGYGAFAAAAAVFALSYGLWWLDVSGVACDPDNHVFTAHGAWHLLGAVSFVFWYRHFAQFEGRPVTEGARAER
ncbi:MAG: ceramidase domain-containing protein [Polyangiaceae bacterium]|nr:ceramidase domain-containing protein [Polyangiaceae bacterium]